MIKRMKIESILVRAHYPMMYCFPGKNRLYPTLIRIDHAYMNLHLSNAVFSIYLVFVPVLVRPEINRLGSNRHHRQFTPSRMYGVCVSFVTGPDAPPGGARRYR